MNLCELSVPGTEARCRPSHYRLSDDPQLRTGARKNCTIDDAALTWACPPPAPAPKPTRLRDRVQSLPARKNCELFSVPNARAGATAGGRREVRASRLQTPNSWQKLALFGGVGAERPRRPRAGAWHRPKSPASTAWTFSLAISGGPPPPKSVNFCVADHLRECSRRASL